MPTVYDRMTAEGLTLDAEINRLRAENARLAGEVEQARAQHTRWSQESSERAAAQITEITRNHRAELDALRAQVPPAEVVEALRTMCELGAYPTVRWFDAQKIVAAWLDNQPKGEK